MNHGEEFSQDLNNFTLAIKDLWASYLVSSESPSICEFEDILQTLVDSHLKNIYKEFFNYESVFNEMCFGSEASFENC